MRPDDRRYMDTHEWAQIVEEVATIGLTDFAIEQLTDLVYIDLPQVGDQLARGDTLGEIESVKAVSDLYAPLGGEVIEVNEPIAEDLDRVSSDPFGEGWFVRLRLSDPSEYDQMITAAEYEAIISEVSS